MKRLVCLLAFCLTASLVLADLPDKTDKFVNDFAQIFDPSKALGLEQELQALSDSTTNQIVVVTVSDLEGYDVADYAQRLGQKWGVGHADHDNGVLILLKPRNETGGGKVFIATGYGVEGVLTDIRCGQIIDNYMMPYLREGACFEAVRAAVDQIEPAMLGEHNYNWDSTGGEESSPVVLLVVLAAIFIGLYIYYHPSPKRQALNSITESESVTERDEAVEVARSLGVKESKIDKALAKIPVRLQEKMREAVSKERFERLASAGLSLGLMPETIDRLRGEMKNLSYRRVCNCRDRSKLDSLAQAALSFGNDEESVRRAVAIALAAIAAASMISYRGSRFRSPMGGSGGTWHSGFGGGHFGGGGAGRSF